MKSKTTLALLMLIMFSLGGLAQKPQKTIRDITEKSPSIHSSYTPYKRPQARDEKVSNLLRSQDNERRYPVSPETDTRLKAEPVNVTFVEKLDSLLEFYYDSVLKTWIPQEAEYYLFDARGRNYSYVLAYYSFDFMDFIPNYRTLIDWNSDNRISQLTEYNWIDTSMSWMPDNRNTFTYNAMGLQTIRTYHSWNYFMQEWIPGQTDTTYYTNSGKFWKRFQYSYDQELMGWYPQYREENSFDGNEFLVQRNSFSWEVDTVERWENSSRTIYNNDEQGRDTLSFDLYWDGMMWDTLYRMVTGYDANGNMILEEEYWWNGEMMWWEGSSKYEYFYDGSNRQIESLYFGWDNNKFDWFIYDKVEYTWDVNNNLLEEIYSNYDTITKVYTPSWKDLYRYDLNLEVTEIAMPYWYGTEIMVEEDEILGSNNKIIDITDLYWNIGKQAWDSSYRDNLHYSGLFDAPVNDTECKADFTWSLDEVEDLLVYFTDKSDTTIVSWYWIFGDGQTSTKKDPKHMFEKPGTYMVMLTTIDRTGFCSNTVVEQIKVGDPVCNANFSYTVDTVKKEVVLTNKSGGSNLQYFWSFGDGSVTDAKDPVYTYTHPGSYQISLTVINDLANCMDMYTASVRVGSGSCSADFAVFVDSSSNTTYLRARKLVEDNKYYWVLGDGTVAFGHNHVHLFSHPGYYTALLTVFNETEGCVESRKETILVGNRSPGGKAAFIYVAGNDNIVAFTNQSLGTNLKYHWDFNDAQTSSETDPVHPYVLPGYYTVCLTVSTEDGIRNTYCQKIFAGTDTKDECLARFTYTLSDDGLDISCIDQSFGSPDQFKWTFNNSDPPLTGPKPKWSTGTPDYVTVHQSILNSNNECRDDAFALINMGEESGLQVAFGYIIDSSKTKATTYPVDFVGISLGDAGKLKWDFGDGSPQDSTTLNPVHRYDDPGSYYVCLTITNSSTGEETESCDSITVGAVSFLEELTSLDVGLRCYPNPFSESALVEIHLAENSEIDLAVYDLMGRKVKSFIRDKLIAGPHTFRLDGSKLEDGNYYLILDTELGLARQLISILR